MVLIKANIFFQAGSCIQEEEEDEQCWKRTIGFEPVWKEKKPNRTEINRFEPVFGSVWFKKFLKNSVWLFILV
jgi:hypothetical protein